MWLRRTALLVAVAALALLLAAGPGVRFGLWTVRTAFELLAWATYLGAGAALLALLALLVPRARKGGAIALCVALLAGVASAAVPLEFRRQARSVPPIHDVTTDTESPPRFEALLAERAGAPNPPQYGGAEVAALQRAAYPDLRPLVLPVPPAQAFSRALAAAEAMGWNVVDADAAAGRIEAVATTLWFGFKDDVVVRITAADGGSRVDVRSKSRLGRGDAGTNARRIRAFLERLA